LRIADVTNAELVATASEALDYTFEDIDLLVTALTHSSVADHRLDSNERLEFLGDAVLGIVICEELYRRFDHHLEGDLTKIKSVVVSRRVCAEVSRRIGLCDWMRLGKGIADPEVIPNSLRADVLEAVIGAIYLDGGLEHARRFILEHMTPYIDRSFRSEHHDNHKSQLQQYVQRHLCATPHYETLDEQGPDHSKCFEICVVIDHRRYPSAWAPSKKQAEQEAARRALEALCEEERAEVEFEEE
jgi:ribonuclease-3